MQGWQRSLPKKEREYLDFDFHVVKKGAGFSIQAHILLAQWLWEAKCSVVLSCDFTKSVTNIYRICLGFWLLGHPPTCGVSAYYFSLKNPHLRPLGLLRQSEAPGSPCTLHKSPWGHGISCQHWSARLSTWQTRSPLTTLQIFLEYFYI